MNKIGHWGAAALVTAPLTATVAIIFNPIPAVIALCFAVGVSKLPDTIEEQLGLEHRSWGHTVWFALGCSLAPILIAHVVTVSAPDFSPVSIMGMLYIISVATLLSLLSHLGADVITDGYVGEFDGYIRPFYPLSKTGYLFRWTNAGNPLWNIGLLSAGLATNAAVLVVLLVSGVGL